MKFLNYADKERVMRAARDAVEITYGGNKIMFFPDISAALRKRRQVFDPVKKQMAALSLLHLTLWFVVIYPTTLLITFQERRHKFDNTAEAEEFVRRLMDSGRADTEQVGAIGEAELGVQRLNCGQLR